MNEPAPKQRRPGVIGSRRTPRPDAPVIRSETPTRRIPPPMAYEDAPEVMTTEETARLLRISVERCEESILAGEIPVRRYGKCVRVFKADLGIRGCAHCRRGVE